MNETDPQKVRSADDASQTELPGADDSADDGSAPMTDWSAGQVILDDYVVERELGQGGMGKVYLLRSRSTGQPFAVKRAFLRNETSRSDFLAELRTWIDLPEHPHLVACRFFRTVGDEVVLFAEFVEGGSLADWIRHRQLTGLEQILDAAIQFAWGLHAAHELGLAAGHAVASAVAARDRRPGPNPRGTCHFLASPGGGGANSGSPGNGRGYGPGTGTPAERSASAVS